MKLPLDTRPSDDVYVQADSSRFAVRFRINDATADTTRHIRRTDIFVYNADGLRELLLTRSYGFLPDSAVFFCKARNVTVVAIANSPRSFNTTALDRYDSIELLTYRFEEDSPTQPVMSGQKDVEAGRAGYLTLAPLLSRVMIGEVANKLKGYVRLEDPRIYLENMNAAAEVLRTEGFHPSEMILSPPVRSLPYDIGVFAQIPGTELFCYPNDSQEATIGTPSTGFVLECEIEGETHQYRVTLPAITRNSTVRVDMTVTGEATFESKIY
ncbi:MAG: hypothetical protein J5737_02020 [Bacteroidales bacterium]|nr:hypothetical protein [Bacteroidales bacterium]